MGDTSLNSAPAIVAQASPAAVVRMLQQRQEIELVIPLLDRVQEFSEAEYKTHCEVLADAIVGVMRVHEGDHVAQGRACLALEKLATALGHSSRSRCIVDAGAVLAIARALEHHSRARDTANLCYAALQSIAVSGPEIKAMIDHGGPRVDGGGPGMEAIILSGALEHACEFILSQPPVPDLILTVLNGIGLICNVAMLGGSMGLWTLIRPDSMKTGALAACMEALEISFNNDHLSKPPHHWPSKLRKAATQALGFMLEPIQGFITQGTNGDTKADALLASIIENARKEAARRRTLTFLMATLVNTTGGPIDEPGRRAGLSALGTLLGAPHDPHLRPISDFEAILATSNPVRSALELPDCTIEELDVSRYVTLNISEATRVKLARKTPDGTNKVRLVCGPCAEAQVITSYDLAPSGSVHFKEGRMTGMVEVCFNGLAESAGVPMLEVTGNVYGSVQSSLLVQLLAQKAICYEFCPERYRTPAQNKIIVAFPGMGVIDTVKMFSNLTLRELAKLSGRELAVRFAGTTEGALMPPPEPGRSLDKQLNALGAKRFGLTMSKEQYHDFLFGIGDTVSVTGLQSRPELNGKEATVVAKLDADTGRVGVRVGREAMRIKACNLVQKERAPISGDI